MEIVQLGEGAIETEAEHHAATIGIAALLIAAIGADAVDLTVGCLNQSGWRLAVGTGEIVKDVQRVGMVAPDQSSADKASTKRIAVPQ